MRPLAKAALCGGLAYCLVNTGRAIWVAPGWSAIAAVLLMLLAILGGASFDETVNGIFGTVVIFAAVWVVGLALSGEVFLAICITVLGTILGVIFDSSIGPQAQAIRDGRLVVVPHEPVHAATVATAAHGSSTFVIPTLNGILVLVVALGLVYGLIMLCRVWNRHRQYNRQLEAFNFALRYEPDARFTCEPPKRPSRKPRAKPQEPEAIYQPPAPVYQAPMPQAAVYQAPARPGWLAQGRQQAGLG